MRSASRFQLVLVTSGNKKNAASLAKALVREKLAACVNILPGIHSIYRWKGKIHRTGEFLLIIKTRRSLTRRVSHLVQRLHMYEVPEILTLPLRDSSFAYVKWLEESTRK